MGKLDLQGQKIGFLGAGAMAQAIGEGLLSSGTLESGDMMASAASNRFEGWWTERDVPFVTNNHELVNCCSIVVIAVKPHLYKGVASALASLGHRYEEKLWVSIMAGVTLSDLESNLGMITDFLKRVVRTIPNTPVKVRKGSVGVTFSDGCTDLDKDIVNTIFSSVARCTEIPERLQNAFAAMAGSGPAYIYQVVEALADGGVLMGLPRDLAMEHAAAMVEGAACMVTNSEGKHPAKLKDEVCSPGGSTIRGVQKLEEGGVRAAFMAAVQAAAERNAELGKQ